MSWSATSTRFLNTSRDGDSTTFLGSLTTLSVKKFFLIFPNIQSKPPLMQREAIGRGFQFQAGKTVPCCRSEQERLLEALAEVKVLQISFPPWPVLFWRECDCTDTAQNLLVSGGNTERLRWGSVGEQCGGVICTISSLALGSVWLQVAGWITPGAGDVSTDSFIVCYSEHVGGSPAWSL